MCVFTHRTYMHACIHAYMCTCYQMVFQVLSVFLCMCMYSHIEQMCTTYIHGCIHTYMLTCLHALVVVNFKSAWYVYVNMCVHVLQLISQIFMNFIIHTHTHIHMHVCMHTCMYIYIYTYVYINTYRCVFGDGCTKFPCFGEPEGQAKLHTYIHTYIQVCVWRWVFQISMFW